VSHLARYLRMFPRPLGQLAVVEIGSFNETYECRPSLSAIWPSLEAMYMAALKPGPLRERNGKFLPKLAQCSADGERQCGRNGGYNEARNCKQFVSRNCCRIA
jgi:hypothetical protein